MKRIRSAQTLCPVCLRRLEGAYEEDGDGAVYLSRTCPQHGRFSVLVWPAREEVPSLCSFEQWHVAKTPSYPERPQTAQDKGCPYDCGLCPSHAQHTCHGLLELTLQCNLACPLCYADAGGGRLPPDPPRETVSRQLKRLLEASGRCNVQLSGGEPTLREDLPDIVREAKALGFPLVQVNTNGVRLGREPALAGKLAEAGLDSVYLQWDSLVPERLAVLRGTQVPGLLELKERAVGNCTRAGLGVVFVATVAAGVNDAELGDLLRDAVSRGPAVRGLHVQPASFFGRSPFGLMQAKRFTLAHVMQAFCDQAPEWVGGGDFHPPHCEHSLCSFNAVYARVAGGLKSEREGVDKAMGGSMSVTASEGSRIAKAYTARLWARPGQNAGAGAGGCRREGGMQDAFSQFLAAKSADRRFTLSAMAFQDALSVDVARLRGCCIHIVRPDGRLVPFCCQNMTSLGGHALYPGRLGLPVGGAS